MRKSAFFLIVLVVITVGSVYAGELSIWINGHDITPSFEGKHSLRTDGVLMVPLRVVADQLGAKLEWVPAEDRIIATRGERVLSLRLGENTAMFNGEALDVGTFVEQVQGLTMVPLRLVAMTLADGIQWNGSTNTAKIIDAIWQPPLTNPDISGQTIVRIQSQDGRTRAGVHLAASGRELGVTDAQGIICVPDPLAGNYSGEMTIGQVKVKSGFHVKNGTATVILQDSFFSPASEAATAEPTMYPEPVIPPVQICIERRRTTVTIEYDQSVPQATQLYIDDLIKDIDPAIRLFVGEPIQDRVYMLSYEPQRHLGWGNDGKTILWTDKLPDLSGANDRRWDEWFTINHIHQFLAGRSIPIPGTRYNENLAHPIKDMIALYLTQHEIRDLNVSSVHTIESSAQSNKLLETLGADVLLNQGSSDGSRQGGGNHDFLWETTSYGQMNAFTIDYAKSVWMTLVQARREQSGSLDFFRSFQELMYSVNPQTDLEFYALIDEIVPGIHGVKASEWLQSTAAFTGQVNEGVTFKLLAVRGSFRNIHGESSPTVIYPLVVNRSPGRVLETPVSIEVVDELGQVVIKEQFRSGFEADAWEPRGIAIPSSLTPGQYYVTAEIKVDGERLEQRAGFIVTGFSGSDYSFGEYILKPLAYVSTDRKTIIRLEYDPSISPQIREYLERLTSTLDPAIRRFAGPPIGNQVLKVKYDPEGLSGMNSDMTVLNLKRLPSLKSDVNRSFDSFFFIEYYHMFHRGRSIPVKAARYGETISQAMKIVISHYLKQTGLRDTFDKPIPYYLRLGSVLENLGPGILLNHGIVNGNPGGSTPLHWKWDDAAQGQQMMNTFTLDYALTPWLKLADAAYRKDGEYDFFARLQDELYAREPKDDKEFYSMIDRLVGTHVNGVTASDWLKKTNAFQGLDQPGVFAKILPVRGDLKNIHGSTSPDFLYPLIVIRDPAAHLWLGPVQISIRDADGKLVVDTELTLKLEHTSSGDTIGGLMVPIDSLKPGQHTVTLTANVRGQNLVVEQQFYVSALER